MFMMHYACFKAECYQTVKLRILKYSTQVNVHTHTHTQTHPTGGCVCVCVCVCERHLIIIGTTGLPFDRRHNDTMKPGKQQSHTHTHSQTHTHTHT